MGVNSPGRCSPYISDRCATVGGGGDSSTEPYIVAHNLILAHAKAYHTYHDKYLRDGGEISIDCDSSFAEPWDPTNDDDIDAVDINTQFKYGWYYDPIFFGNYPDSMI